ncbi:tRNA-splicing endonuclease subunit Sen34 [Pelomyxa schiedti]|nr:tRNA-splicing endonuclease subunit Sen34 [Pelomyxa schiedti]
MRRVDGARIVGSFVGTFSPFPTEKRVEPPPADTTTACGGKEPKPVANGGVIATATCSPQKSIGRGRATPLGRKSTGKNKKKVFCGLPVLLCPEEVSVASRFGSIRLPILEDPYAPTSTTSLLPHTLETAKKPQDVSVCMYQTPFSFLPLAPSPPSHNALTPSGNSSTCSAASANPNHHLQQHQLLQQQAMVFSDLRDRGYYLTNGTKFGVTYLAYKGDPATCHACLMVLVVDRHSKLSAMTLVELGRLATAVNKTTVLASVLCPCDHCRNANNATLTLDTTTASSASALSSSCVQYISLSWCNQGRRRTITNEDDEET